MHSFAIVLPILLSLPLALAAQVDLYHRVLSPSAPITHLFTPRGTLDVSSAYEASFTPLPSLEDDVRRLIKEAGEGEGREEALYQVALKRGDEWLFSSVKACHALSGSGEVITLRTSPVTHEPYSITYSLLSVPPSNACPPLSPLPSSALQAPTIKVRQPDWVPPMELRAPPKVDAEGLPVKVEPEKNFVQKYWMYLLPAVLVLLMAPGGDAPQGAAK